MSNPSIYSYAAGASGTVTVPTSTFVTGFSCHATSAGTLTIAPSGPDVTSPVTGPSIPIPAGTSLSVSAPTLHGQQDELGDGTVFTFTGTDSYIVWYQKY